MKSLTKLLFIFCLFIFQLSYADTKEELAITDPGNNQVGFYDDNGHLRDSVKVGHWPHEIIVSKDQRTAYASNFGLLDYDEKHAGSPGASISVIDIPSHTEKYRLYTFDADKKEEYSKIICGPHGLRLRPPSEDLLYVNTEINANMIVFNVKTRKIVNQFPINPDTHNFFFSPDGKKLWLMTGKSGVIQIDPNSGTVIRQYQSPSTIIRGLYLPKDGQYLIASGNNEILLLNTSDLSLYKKISNLNAHQLLYSAVTPDKKYIITPDLWNSVAIIIDAKTGKVVKRIATGINPVHIKLSLDGNKAYVTAGRDNYLTEINLKTFEARKIYAGNGANGLVVIPATETIPHKTFTIGIPLPMSGKDAKAAAEMMLGYEFWNINLRKSGGLFVHNQPYFVNIVYLDTQSQDTSVAPLTNDLINQYHVDALLSTYGENAIQIEKDLAKKHHILFIPLPTLDQKAWNPQLDLATGEDIYMTPKEYQRQYKNYYYIDPTHLAAASTAALIQFQQALLATNNFDYQSLTDAFQRNHFHTFISGLEK